MPYWMMPYWKKFWPKKWPEKRTENWPESIGLPPCRTFLRLSVVTNEMISPLPFCLFSLPFYLTKVELKVCSVAFLLACLLRQCWILWFWSVPVQHKVYSVHEAACAFNKPQFVIRLKENKRDDWNDVTNCAATSEGNTNELVQGRQTLLDMVLPPPPN